MAVMGSIFDRYEIVCPDVRYLTTRQGHYAQVQSPQWQDSSRRFAPPLLNREDGLNGYYRGKIQRFNRAMNVITRVYGRYHC